MGGQLDFPSAEPTPDTSADAPRTWLIGEQNPYGADPAFALYPLPENAAGARLGARVSAAFGVPFRERLFDPEVCVLRAPDIRRRILVAPHPSGRSREWNDPRAPERLRAALARLESGESPA